MGNFEHGVASLLRAFQKDCTAQYPELHLKLSSDIRVLEKRIKSRGLSILLIDLPTLGKLYDKGLSTTFLDLREIPHTLGSWSKGTVLFQCLLSYTFDSKGEYREPDPTTVLFTRTLLNLFKKIDMECANSSTLSAVADFIHIERGLLSGGNDWNSDSPKDLDRILWRSSYKGRGDATDDHYRSSVVNGLNNYLARVCMRTIPQVEVRPEYLLPRHGPGAVSDKKSGHDKYSDVEWSTRLDLLFPHSFYMSYDGLGELAHSGSTIPSDQVESRLIAVPKTYKGPRLIASEPTANQFLQQGLMELLRTNLTAPLQKCIDFKSQEPSRDAALQASKDGESVTVDLSSASDRLTTYAVESVFWPNPDLLSALWATRTQRVTLSSIKERLRKGNLKSRELDVLENLPDTIELKKFACQGSAVTFPVQSIVYANFAIAALLYAENRTVTARNVMWAARRVRVFGDDIIVPKQALIYLGMYLAQYELKVNMGKTHYYGQFRESCGMDAFRGFDVSPVYIRAVEPGKSPQQIQSWLDVSNNAYRSGFWHLAKYMDTKLPKEVWPFMYTGRLESAGLSRLCYSVRSFHSVGGSIRSSKEWNTLQRFFTLWNASSRVGTNLTCFNTFLKLHRISQSRGNMVSFEKLG